MLRNCMQTVDNWGAAYGPEIFHQTIRKLLMTHTILSPYWTIGTLFGGLKSRKQLVCESR
ncbi:hypothetical protein T08_16216 [Trichinella sp. T8]|nr:hypothetical protein T08_16216 [Trichinella sp. T8]